MTSRLTSIFTHFAMATCAVVTLLSLRAQAQDPIPSSIRFNRDVRPILADTCFKCHGFDPKERKADLRLDTAEGALAALKKGTRAIVPGDPAASEAWRRIISDEADEVMPPAKSVVHPLTAPQKAVLKRWIEQGAKYEAHWSFVAPVRAQVPNGFEQIKLAGGADSPAKWVRNPIDAFLLDRLLKEGLKPSPEADKVTLIRRVTLDLTGLPPTPAEVGAFVGDASPDAYGKVVDRLLSSPRYGERMAVDWLDAARFADTHGYHIDAGRDMTRWREWVIDAFTTNKPYDKFIVEQLAGDLLPGATIDQRIASGFNRNHMINFEGGADPNEYHTAYVLDRVNTTGTVFLGLTVACAQCHDHKFDPITQKDFYSLFALFNNVPEQGLDGRKGNAEPKLATPTQDQALKLSQLASDLKAAEAKLDAPELAAAQAAWEQSLQAADDGKATWTVLDATDMKSAGGATLARLADGAVVVSGVNAAKDTYTIAALLNGKSVTAVKLEVLPDDALAARGPGRSENGNAVMTRFALDIAGKPAKLRSASADFSQDDYPVENAIDGKAQTGWAIYPEVGKPHQAVFELAEPAKLEAGAAIRITLDFQSRFGQHQFGKFRLSVTDAKLSPAGKGKLSPEVAAAIALEPGQRNAKQKKAVRDQFVKGAAPEVRKQVEDVEALKKSVAALEAAIPSTMVMAEMDKPRDTFVLMRGEFDKPSDRVTGATPGFLPPLPNGAPSNRLGLARWLVDPSQPLTARVTVNRYWQMFFGTGLVKTAEDFGTQGELPSNPELLDWLAVDFRESDWDLRRLVKQIVSSSAYRQSSRVTPELLAKDPENRLLARGPRFRLQAEFIRDGALAASGLLDGRIGGASVSPYQPAGLWEELMSRNDGANWSAQKYDQSHGPDLYRRTMYTFWKRTSPPPTLQTFDAPGREVCTVRRARTNTPLQALVLMNDPTYVEAARKLAERVMREAGPAPRERIDLMFRLLVARPPTNAESGVLMRMYDEQLKAFAADGGAAMKLLAVGESPRDETLPIPELAAGSAVASVILNLDETVTRN